MHASLIRRTLPKLIFVLGAVIVGTLMAGKDSTNVDAFVSTFFQPTGSATPSSTGTSAAADLTVTLGIVGPSGANTGDYNFGAVTYFTPSAASIHPTGADTPPIVGDIVGTLSSDTTLGLTNNPCDPAGTFNIPFTWINATISTADVITPLPQTTTDPGGVLGAFNDDDDGDTVVEVSDTNGLPNHVDHWPSYNSTLFPGITPKARYSSSNIVAGSTVVIVEWMIFDLPPNGLDDLAVPNGGNDLGNSLLGYPQTIVLQDPTQPAAPSDITDFCAPLSTSTVLYGNPRTNPCNGNNLGACGTVPGINAPTPGAVTTRVRCRNPSSAGTYRYPLVVASLRDSDGDGVENALDTCPNHSTPSYNPRNPLATQTAGHDDDDDLLAAAGIGGCDPNDSDNVGPDNQDGDAGTLKQWLNGNDNCPLVSDNTNADTELGAADAVATPRGGSQGDGMGDVCDLSETGGDCTDTVDDDSDGLMNDGCASLDNPVVGVTESGASCTNGAFLDEDSDGAPNDGCTGANAKEVGCLNTTDDDGDGRVNDGCASSNTVSTGLYIVEMDENPYCIGGTDTDTDGWCDTTETAYGSIASGGGAAASTPEHYDFYIPFPVAHSGAGSPTLARHPLQACTDAVDNDGNGGSDNEEDDGADAGTNDDCAPPQPVPDATDSDGDGTRDEAEIFMGTDAMGRCGAKGGVGPSTAWPADLAGSDDKIDVLDLSTYVGTPVRLNKSPGSADYSARWDAVPGPAAPGGFWVDVLDLQAVFQIAPSMPPYLGAAAFQNFGKICTSDPLLND